MVRAPALAPHPRVRRVAVLLAWLAAAPGCVTRERDAAVAAREDWRECVATHSESHPDCVVLRDRYQTEAVRYEESARRAWSCNPAHSECPRDGSAGRGR